MTDFSIYLVTDPELGGGPDKVVGIVEEAIRGGVSVVQLRDKLTSDKEFRQRAVEIKAVCDSYQVPLFINDRIQIALELGLHLHIGQGDIPYVKARRLMPAHLMVGLSIENTAQLSEVITTAEAAGVPTPDVIGIGPVQETNTKPDAAAELGIDGVGMIAARAKAHGIASVAIGGVGLHNAADLARTDIDGLCIVSAVMAAESPRDAAHTLNTTWKANS